MKLQCVLDESNNQKFVVDHQSIAHSSLSVSRCTLQAQVGERSPAIHKDESERKWNFDNRQLKVQAGIEDEEEIWIPLSPKSDKKKPANNVELWAQAKEKRIRERYQALWIKHPRMKTPFAIKKVEEEIQDMHSQCAHKIKMSKKNKVQTKAQAGEEIPATRVNEDNNKNNDNTRKAEAIESKIRKDYQDLWERSPKTKTALCIKTMEDQIQFVRTKFNQGCTRVSETIQKVNEDHKITETIVENKVQIGAAVAVAATAGVIGYTLHKHCKANQSERKNLNIQSACETSVFDEVGPKFWRNSRQVCVRDSLLNTDNWEGMIIPYCENYWLIPSKAFKDSTHIQVQSMATGNFNTINEIVGPERYVQVNKDLTLIELLTGGSAPNLNKFTIDEFKSSEVVSLATTSVSKEHTETNFAAVLGKDGRITMHSDHIEETLSGAPILTRECEFAGIVLSSSQAGTSGAIFTTNDLEGALNSLKVKIADFKAKAREIQLDLVAQGKDPLCAQAGEEFLYEATMGWLPNHMRYRNARPQGGKFYTRIMQSFGKAVANVAKSITSFVRQDNDNRLLKVQSGTEDYDDEIPINLDKAAFFRKKGNPFSKDYIPSSYNTVVKREVYDSINQLREDDSFRKFHYPWFPKALLKIDFDATVKYTQAFSQPILFPHSGDYDDFLSVMSRDVLMHRYIIMLSRKLLPEYFVLPSATVMALTEIVGQWMFYLGFRKNNYRYSIDYFIRDVSSAYEFMAVAIAYAKRCFKFEGESFYFPSIDFNDSPKLERLFW